MKLTYKALLLSASLALIGGTLRPAMADEWNKRTEFTFSGPVEIPGHILTAGKYVFQLAASDSNRDIVQIFSEDDRGKLSLVSTLLAVPDYEYRTPDKAGVRFEERPSGMPEAIRSWYYPGDNTGWEFIYSKHDRAKVTSAAMQPPAATPAPEAERPAADLPVTPPVDDRAALAGEAVVSEEQVEPVVDQTPTEPALPATPDAEAVAQDTDTATPMLPQTAGNSGVLLAGGIAMTIAGLTSVIAPRH